MIRFDNVLIQMHMIHDAKSSHLLELPRYCG